MYVLQYIILGAFEGAALDVLSVVSTVAAHNKDKGFILKHTKLVIIIINIIMVISGLLLYKNIFSLFPLIGAMLQNGAFWSFALDDISEAMENDHNVVLVEIVNIVMIDGSAEQEKLYRWFELPFDCTKEELLEKINNL